jgi:signal transduction histidine kinase
MMSQPLSTILVIDDDQIARETLQALLADSTYQLIFAANGIQGLEMARTARPDVVLLDVMMPEMDGFEVCRRLRADRLLAEVPIIMITALDDRDSKIAGFSAGADEFLSKPFDSTELGIRLRTITRLDRYHRLLTERQKLSQALEQLAEKNEQLQRISRQLLQTQENERRKLAAELHDEIGQILTGLKLLLAQVQGKPADESAVVVKQSMDLVDEMMERVRQMSLDLRPAVLDDFGLSAALNWLFRRFSQQTQIEVISNVDGLNEQRFPKMIETSTFRIVQEALTNVARYAKVQQVNVALNIETDKLQIYVIDSGTGFDFETLPPGRSNGLSGMQERAILAGGQFYLHSAPGDGTLVMAEFPLQEGE